MGGPSSGLTTVRRCLVAWMLVYAGQPAWCAPTFDTCQSSVAARPAEYESYRCFYEVAAASGEWQAAARHLEKLAAKHPRIDWIVFVRATVTSPTDRGAAERLYLEAAQRFEAAGNVRGEVLARTNIQRIFFESGRIGSAAQQIERITSLADDAADVEIRTRARVTEAQFYIATGTHLGRAQRALQQAEADLAAVPAYWLRRDILQSSGNVHLLLGQVDEALTDFQRLLEEAQTQGDLQTEARARLSLVNALVEKRGEQPDAVDAAQLYLRADEALAAARRGADVGLELAALRLLGESLLFEQPQRARGYIDDCVERAQAAKRGQLLSNCLWVRAQLLADADPDAAQETIDGAINLLHYEEGANYRSLAYAWRHAMRIAWQTQAPDEAIATGQQALMAIERLRNLQPGAESRAAAFSAWTQDYYWLSGRILQLATTDRRPELLSVAFQVGEQMRARSLLDLLRAAPGSLVDLDEAAMTRREGILKEIVDVNRQLLQAREPDRASLLGKLETLERQELDAREAGDRSRAAAAPVTLDEVQQSLAENEALLAFQTGLRGPDDRDASGSWLYVVTRQQARVRELPDRHELNRSLSLYKGLMHQPAALRHRAGSALYERLLKNALDAMPSGIERLIVVPDLPFDTFPLAALSESGTRGPLARQYEIVLVPSATIWHEWRTRAAAAPGRSALVLADPQLEFSNDAASERRSWSMDSGVSLGPLPHARAEGRAILERLDRNGTLWTGAEASETALKAQDLSRYGVLHFAAHTVIDSVHTDRSAILLASGADHQDGLLQSREIADLRLDRQLVVLSSCQSATGTQLRGEGVMGLARSFFAAGAHTVIGSLWPVRDDHAEAFFAPFYASLAEGRRAGAAFHEAQKSLIDAGMPMEAWAGFVLMGDPDAAPVPAMQAGRASQWTLAAALLLLLLSVVAAVLYFRGRSRPPTPA